MRIQPPTDLVDHTRPRMPAEADALQTTHLREVRAFDLDSEASRDGLVRGLGAY
jgi:hypothetical protein